MSHAELIERLKAWARRYEPRSPERNLFLESAARLEETERRIAEAGADSITVASVEKAMGKSLLPWQRKLLSEREANGQG